MQDVFFLKLGSLEEEDAILKVDIDLLPPLRNTGHKPVISQQQNKKTPALYDCFKVSETQITEENRAKI